MRRLNIHNYKGITEEDNTIIEGHIINEVELFVDDIGMVYTESDIYIADIEID